ncbi:MAG: glycosyltransferase [bacterium]|nr:glycosyltransferase [bacterium]
MSKLTVLMTVYNGATYLPKTMESILEQSYRDFTFLIVDNASTDDSRNIIRSYNDYRVQLVELPENIGQVAALNKGLELIEDGYVARMDADDISLPDRFKRQVDFLDANPSIGICGTRATTFGAKTVTWAHPSKPEDIKVKLLFECALVHPSVMMRKERLDKFNLTFDASLNHSYDWDLWLRASRHMDIANIPEVLLQYRLHQASESTRTLDLQESAAKKLDDESLAFLGLQNHPLRPIHRDTAAETLKILNREEEFLHLVKEWFDTLKDANRIKRIYQQEALERFLDERFFIVLTKNTRHWKTAFKYYKQKKLYRRVPLIWSLKFLLKTALAVI